MKLWTPLQIVAKRTLLLVFILVSHSSIAALNNTTDLEINSLLDTLRVETLKIQSRYNQANDSLVAKIHGIQIELHSQNITNKTTLIVKEANLIKQLTINRRLELAELNKARYLKGLQIMKILYEKLLSLDHHFASVSTFHEVNTISNPNNYAEFASIKELVDVKNNSKTGFNLGKVLNNNLYTTIIHSFISIFNNENKSKDHKEQVMSDMECILDFSLRMHNDLNTIHFETIFLQKNNDEILTDLQKLFKEYTMPINYHKSLIACRETDDWSIIQDSLGSYTTKLAVLIRDDFYSTKARKMQVNLQFPIDRLIQFTTTLNKVQNSTKNSA